MGHGKSSVRSSPSTSGGFNPSERLSEEHLKYLELVRKVGLNKLEEEDFDSLLETIDEELSTEELDELEKQHRQLEEEVEAQQQSTVPTYDKAIDGEDPAALLRDAERGDGLPGDQP